MGYSLAGGDLTGTIVGVVADVGTVRPGLPQPESAHLVYIPFAKAGLLGGLAFVRGHGGLEVLSFALSEELTKVEPFATAYAPEMYDDRRARSLWIERQLRTLSGIFAAVALLFAAGSLYSLVALLVERRAAELALRSALGATPQDLRSIVLAFAGRALALGLLPGALFSLGLGRAVQGFLYATTPWDPRSAMLALVVVSTAALLACLAPAERAARVDPAPRLKAE